MSVLRLQALFVFLCASLIQSHAQQLTIAAAADLHAPLSEIAANFQHKTGTRVNLSFGSSGNFFSQIKNGAPFELFFSADMDYPKKLDEAGLAEPGTFFQYATGKIVVWVPKSSRLDVKKLGMESLMDPIVRKIAIADPRHAPYGRAAMAAMEHFHIAEKVRGKLVLGENISQAAQFIQTGNAQVGIIALSLALSPALKSEGKYWTVPEDAYPPLQQGCIILKLSKNKSGANTFLDYLKTPAATDVMKRYGFVPSTGDMRP